MSTAQSLDDEVVCVRKPKEESKHDSKTTKSRHSSTSTIESPGAVEPEGGIMGDFSFREMCCLFCCPPCPSRITSKLAFFPPTPTYTFVADNAGGRAASSANITYKLQLSERAEWQYSDSELDRYEVFYANTSRGNRIACMYLRVTSKPKYTLLFSHGNAVDLGQMSSFYLSLGTRVDCNVFSYDYSGYGRSSGRPTEKNIYADINAAWHALRTRYNVAPENVILYGQSIGTVASIDLASKYEVGAVILHSPLMSGMRLVFPNTKRTWFFDAFPSIDKVPKINSPVLVIHGMEDELVDFSHGVAIYEKCIRAVDPLWVEGAGHNDIEVHGQYLERLKHFITHDLKSSAASTSVTTPDDEQQSQQSHESKQKKSPTASAKTQ